jgi:predicted transcriptional regulator
MVKLDQINLSNNGLTKFFSPIEAKIMEVLWSENELLTAELTRKTQIPLSSVAGTLDRLVKAGYVERRIKKINGRPKYIYSAVHTPEEAAGEITKRVLDNLVETFGEVAVEHFSKYEGRK